MQGPPTSADVWAKLKKDDAKNIVAWHTLLGHSADVSVVFGHLLTNTVLGARLSKLAGWDTLTQVHVQRLSFLAALHDIGKTCGGFQRRASGAPGTDHLTPLLAELDHDQVFAAQLFQVQKLQTWVGDPFALMNWVMALVGHHGSPVTEYNYHRTAWTTEDKQLAIIYSQIMLRLWFPKAITTADPFPMTPALQHAFNGVLTLADWIGSDPRFFPFDDPKYNLPETCRGNDKRAIESRAEFEYERARFLAKRAVKELQLYTKATKDKLEMPLTIADVLGVFDPYDMQKAVDNLPPAAGGSVAVLESDTGSGKTEAAIARFLKLYQAGEVDGMYFAVPTRSAATELHTRITNVVQNIFPNDWEPAVVQAVPGQAKADHNIGYRINPFDVKWADDYKLKGWAAESSKKYLAAPIAVGTVDQVLMSTLQTRHAHMRQSALLRHLIVVDEVHSSDTYMTELQSRVVSNHLRAGGHVLLMSATIASEARHKLITGEHPVSNSYNEAKRTPYPLVSFAEADSRMSVTQAYGKPLHAHKDDEQKKVQVSREPIAELPEEIASRAIDDAQSGAKVLIIRNTVRDCLATQEALENILSQGSPMLFKVKGAPAPHHSRYSASDRRALDKQIEQELGKGSPRKQGKIIVATSTVEQSLDIDAEVLYSDLCPADVLLQRIGRVHRHDNPRPKGYEVAKVIVLTQGKGCMTWAIRPEGPPKRSIGQGLGYIYSDLRALEATRRSVAMSPTWFIPRDNRRIVEQCAHSFMWSRLEKENPLWKKHSRWVDSRIKGDETTAGLFILDTDIPFSELKSFNALEEIARTRLGVDNFEANFEEAPKGPFGNKTHKLPIPGWMAGKGANSTMEPVLKTAVSASFTFTFNNRHYKYDRYGLQLIK